ncbi:MAG TPA: L,D-transpeptidase [Longimicrobium sp.]
MSAILAPLAAAVLAAHSPCPAGDPLPHPLPPPDTSLSMVLNIPAFRLDVRNGEGIVRSYTVAVGSRRYRTPTGQFGVSSVELNPWWHPPDSPWARDEKVTPPGPDNPMGPAKLNFHELYFLHGTPWERSLGSAASHGCVRMAPRDVRELARMVLAATRPDVSAAEVDAAEADPRRTRRYALRRPVPLQVRYQTAEVRGDTLELHPDVYGRERTTLRARALEALRQAGVVYELIDTAKLDSLVRAGRRGHARLALEELLVSPAALPVPDVPASPVPLPERRRR